jgi:hypothetical protein
MAEPGESEAEGPSGTRKHYIHRKEQKIDFPWQKDVLIRVLHNMGFTWKQSVSKEKLIVERRAIIDCRCRYLIKMPQVRGKFNNILFIDEAWVDRKLTFQKCWQGPGIRGVWILLAGALGELLSTLG